MKIYGKYFTILYVIAAIVFAEKFTSMIEIHDLTTAPDRIQNVISEYVKNETDRLQKIKRFVFRFVCFYEIFSDI